MLRRSLQDRAGRVTFECRPAQSGAPLQRARIILPTGLGSQRERSFAGYDPRIAYSLDVVRTMVNARRNCVTLEKSKKKPIVQRKLRGCRENHTCVFIHGFQRPQRGPVCYTRVCVKGYGIELSHRCEMININVFVQKCGTKLK